MAINELTIIGESINDSVPATRQMFDDGDVEIAAQAQDGVPGNAGENGVAEWRRIDLAVTHDKNIFARAFTDVAGGIESNSLVVAVDVGFHPDELRVEIVSSGF